MTNFYMTERCGAWQVGEESLAGPVEFKIFFPDRAKDASQYNELESRVTYGDPRITGIRVVGDFMNHLGLADWDRAAGPAMTRTEHAKGCVWTYRTPVPLPAGFYEYKYLVTFANGTTRMVSDPCSRYGGKENENAAVVVGGSTAADTPVAAVAGGRKHLRDLVVYELMIDDFTDEYRGFRAPLDAVRDKLDYLQNLGVNAILFMPWTAWPGEGFSWGYTPMQYFSVEYRYANALNAPAEKLSWLSRLVDDCHRRGIHVIMDGVFNHVGDVNAAPGDARGFPYRWLYQNQLDSPYVGTFGGEFPGLLDLNYHNGCTQQFIGDVCWYWIDECKLDGIRFDNTTNFYLDHETRGLPTLLKDIRAHVGDPNFSLTLEHLRPDAAPVASRTGATSYWNNELYGRTFEFLWNWRIDGRLLAALNTHPGLDDDKVATTYIVNHDHSHVAWQAGARDNAGALQWYRVQPYAIALLTAPGSPMLQNGQEFAEDYWIMEDDHGSSRRVKPRPLRWGFADDKIGRPLRQLISTLTAVRHDHPGLRSDNIYPAWEGWMTQFDAQGYGVDVDRGLVIFHRWGNAGGRLERFIVVLNFSAEDRWVDVPFPENGIWTDLLTGAKSAVGSYMLHNVPVGSNWGHVYFQ